MAISFVAAGTEGSGSAGTTVSPGLPSGIQANDILICCAACWDGNAVGSMDASWTRVVENSNGTSYCSMAVFWHRYDGSNNPSTTVTFSGSSGDGKVAGIAAFRGCKTSGSPINVQSTDNNGTSTTTITHLSITTTVDGCMLLCINGTDENDDRGTLASGFTNIFEDTTAGTDNAFRQTECSIHASYKDQGSQGSTGNLDVTGTGFGGWASELIALEPAATGSVFSASGSGAMTMTGAAEARSGASMAGVGTAAFTGAAVAQGVLSSSAVAALTATGRSDMSGVFSASGVSELVATGRSDHAGALSVSAIADFNAQSAVIAQAAFSMAGVGSFSVVGESFANGVLSASAIASMAMSAQSGSDMQMAGVATATFIGEAVVESVWSSSAVGEFSAVGTSDGVSEHSGKRRIKRGMSMRVRGYLATRGKLH